MRSEHFIKRGVELGLFNFLKKKGSESSSDSQSPGGKENNTGGSPQNDPFGSLGDGLPPLPPMPDMEGNPAGVPGNDNFGDLPPIRAPSDEMPQPAEPDKQAGSQDGSAQDEKGGLTGESSNAPPTESVSPQQTQEETPAPEGQPAQQFPPEYNQQIPELPSDEELFREGSNPPSPATPPEPTLTQPMQSQTAPSAQQGFRMFPDKPISPEVRDFGAQEAESEGARMFPDTFAEKTDEVGSFMAGRSAGSAAGEAPAPPAPQGGVPSDDLWAPKPSIPTLAVKDETLRGRPLFIRADLYSDALKDVDDAKLSLRDAEEALMRAKDIREQIDKQYQKWHDSLEDIQRKLVLVDQKLFE
ncbi:hypothetical protein D6764_00770 [Candidatus Woesearchaeota archaeon]|nr:MAG: hypothetical protein D6764_00770 [Candidatus Woesearchaeota archaeon]